MRTRKEIADELKVLLKIDGAAKWHLGKDNLVEIISALEMVDKVMLAYTKGPLMPSNRESLENELSDRFGCKVIVLPPIIENVEVVNL